MSENKSPVAHPVVGIFIAINIEEAILDCFLYEKRVRTKESNVMIYSSRENMLRTGVELFW